MEVEKCSTKAVNSLSLVFFRFKISSLINVICLLKKLLLNIFDNNPTILICRMAVMYCNSLSNGNFLLGLVTG